MTAKYIVASQSETAILGDLTFDTYDEAVAYVQRELSRGDSWCAEQACIVHPDGRHEYWRSQVEHTAVQTDDDWYEEESVQS